MVFIPDFDNGTKNIILHLHKASVCSVGAQGNSISKEIKEMPQALSILLFTFIVFSLCRFFKKYFILVPYSQADRIIET